MTTFTESIVEQAALAWLEATGWRIAPGPSTSRRPASRRVGICGARSAATRLTPKVSIRRSEGVRAPFSWISHLMVDFQPRVG